MPARSKASPRKSKDPCAELKRKLKERDAELKDARAQQAAVSDILRAISGTGADVKPVLRSIAEHAMRLCGSHDARIWIVEGDRMKYVTGCGEIPALKEGDTMTITRGIPRGRAIVDRKPVHIADAATVSPKEFPLVRKAQRLHGHRTVLAVPLMREKRALGAIALRKMVVEPYTKQQIELVRMFADQAAIAIENSRLLKKLQAGNTDLTEALEQQIATSEVLRVIASSPNDLKPVLETVIANAVKLAGATQGHIRQYDGEVLRFVVSHGETREQVATFQDAPLRPDAESFSARAFLEKRPFHVPDVQAGREGSRAVLVGARTLLAAPLLREGAPIGVVTIWRSHVEPFSQRQISLVQTFADQAVIAIENVRLFKELQARNQELTESLARQTATSEILRIISSSPTDTQPVFDAIVKSGVRLFGGLEMALRLVKGDQSEIVATSEPIINGDRRPSPLDDDKRASTRAIRYGQIVQIADIPAEAGEVTRARAARTGARALLHAPLLREGKAIGVISVYRGTPGSFTEKEVALLKTFADQAVIAIENVRLFNETKEALEQQTVISDILRIISSSPTDTQPVFDAIVKSGVQLFGGMDVSLRLVRDHDTELVASTLSMRESGGFSAPRDDGSYPTTRAILLGELVQIQDVFASSWVNARVRRRAEQRGWKAIMIAPMLREGKAIGTVNVNRAEPGPFTDKQIALLKTFADQAVIAIENVRLFRELQARNAEITEALEQQTATSDILRVISSSPTDLQPVFDAILEKATRLCDAHLGTLGVYDGTHYENVAQRGGTPAYVKYLFSGPFDPHPDSAPVIGRLITEREPIHIPDFKETPYYRAGISGPRAMVELGGGRTVLAVPMLKEGRAVGGIFIYRPEVRPFTQKQIDLLGTFANQAVIAIENVRLFNETKEALEQQTATSEILKVISGSPTDIQPVFDVILENAMRLCDANMANLRLFEGNVLRRTATGGSPEYARWVAEEGHRHASQPDGMMAQLIAEKQPVQILDRRETSAYRRRVPSIVALVDLAGIRTSLAVPMLKEGRVVGAIAINRQEVRAFTQKQIDLIKTFADQAVIAIENVRLFNETKEALEQQTATAEILKVISSSPTDVQPVFDAIVQSGVRLFEGAAVAVALPDGDQIRAPAIAAGDPGREAVWKGRFPFPFTRDYIHGAAILDCKPVDIPDAEQDEGDWKAGIKNFLASGYRAMTIMPMAKGENAIGAISVLRLKPGLLSAKQMALLQTFADQAVIAIENVRLFNETKEALEQQTVISEILRVIGSSPTDTQPVFNAIASSGVHLFRGLNVTVLLVKGDQVDYVASTIDDTVGTNPLPLHDDSTPGPRAIVRREVVQVPDISTQEWVSAGMKQRANQRGFRSIMVAPMLRGGNAIGAISVTRATAGPFTDKQIALVKTFADQAVIAIENVRLFNEIQDKSRQLEIANKHKSEFLANMSHELRTPLNAIIGFSEALIEKMFGEMNEKQEEYLNDIHSSGKHLLSLINDILDLSKVEAGRMELEPSEFQLPAALHNALTLVRERAQTHGIALGLNMDPGLRTLYADERKFKQIVVNLLSNAVKFTPDGGRVEVDARPNGALLEVSVKDTGIGIAREDREAVFEEFRQVGHDYTHKQEGTGLGLALTRRFVELHGGTIRLESEPGRGSTFTFTLPLNGGQP